MHCVDRDFGKEDVKKDTPVLSCSARDPSLVPLRIRLADLCRETARVVDKCSVCERTSTNHPTVGVCTPTLIPLTRKHSPGMQERSVSSIRDKKERESDCEPRQNGRPGPDTSQEAGPARQSQDSRTEQQVSASTEGVGLVQHTK
jgi:hypothetical protein